jgi:histidyl-tRNA synthetase
MREANKLNTRYVIFFGGDEYATGYFSLKNMQTSEQKQLLLSELENIMID